MLQNALNNLCRWMDQWELNIATEKLYVISIVKNYENMALYNINDYELCYVTCYKNLCINISNNLRFTDYINDIC